MNNYKRAKYWFDDESQVNTIIEQLDNEDIFTQIITGRFKISDAVINEQGEVLKQSEFKDGLMVDVTYIGNTEPSYIANYRVDLDSEGRLNVDGLSYLENKL